MEGQRGGAAEGDGWGPCALERCRSGAAQHAATCPTQLTPSSRAREALHRCRLAGATWRRGAGGAAGHRAPSHACHFVSEGHDVSRESGVNLQVSVAPDSKANLPISPASRPPHGSTGSAWRSRAGLAVGGIVQTHAHRADEVAGAGAGAGGAVPLHAKQTGSMCQCAMH